MKANNIVSAPQVRDVDMLYEVWRKHHTGSRATFYRFLTTPSVEREAFVNSVTHEVGHIDKVATITLTAF